MEKYNVVEPENLSKGGEYDVKTVLGGATANGVGIIDSDYVEESYILLHNVSDSLVVIANGERLAQCVLEPVLQYDIEEVSEPPSQKTDRDGGIGSTGN